MTVLDAPVPALRGPLWTSFKASLRENSPLILFAMMIAPAPYIVAARYDIPSPPYTRIDNSYVGFYVTAFMASFVAFALWYLYHARVRKVPDFQSVAWRRLKGDFLGRERVMLALPVLLLWPITACAFSYLKAVIPLIEPFHLDPTLHQLDRAVHFGADPWRLLHPLLGYKPVTYVINYGYAMWFFVLVWALVMQAASTGERRRRMQFLLTMALSWTLIGNVAATFLSSVGPCYYALVFGGPDPYQPLMTYLRDVADALKFTVGGREIQVPFLTLVLQDILWQSQVDGDFGLAKGISAAPSMHVASSWIIARLAWSLGRPARIFGSLFLLLILVGSVHLGWHYAMDGYIAIACAWALWRLVGWWLERPRVETFLFAPARA
jgi:hypothetical protein